MSRLIFMSPDHLARMNELLAADAASKAACASLGRRWYMVYELSHGSQTVWWTMRFDPADGVSFSLDPPSQPADIRFHGDYRAMLEWMRRHKAGEQPGAEPVTQSGNPDGMNIIAAAFQAAGKAATLETEILVA